MENSPRLTHKERLGALLSFLAEIFMWKRRRSVYEELRNLRVELAIFERAFMSKSAELQTAVSGVASAVDAAVVILTSGVNAGNSTPDADVQSAIDSLTAATAKLNNAAGTAQPTP